MRRKRQPLLRVCEEYSEPIKKIIIILVLPLLIVVHLIMVHIVLKKLVILTLYFPLFSFIVKSSDGKIHGYILRTVELAEGTMATHTLKMPMDNVRNITAKLELLEPQIN